MPARKLSDLGEFGLIGRIRDLFPAPEGVTGIGDDCAVLPQRSGRDTLVSTDMLVEGTHFLRADIPPYRLGWKSAAVNVSDIAGMGGRPTATFLSVALPADLDADWMGEFLEDCCEIDPSYREKSGELYQEYRAWCLRMGEYARGTADFYGALAQRDFERKKTKKGIMVLGLRIKSEFDS